MIRYELKQKLNELARQDFDLTEMVERYEYAKRYRQNSGAEIMMDIGTRILKNDLSSGVYGTAKDKRNFDNIINRNLFAKKSRLIAHDINVRLHNPINTNPISQDVLEAEVNYSLDLHRLIRSTDGSITNNQYWGIGYVKTGWDKYYFAPGWETGKPTARVCDSRKMYISPHVTDDYQKDNHEYWEVFTYEKRILKKKLKAGEFGGNIGDIDELLKKIDNHHEINNLIHQEYGYGEFIDVVVCQYYNPYSFTMRAIKDYVSDDEPLIEVIESELLAEIGQDKVELLDDVDDDTLLPEGLRASAPYERRIDSWFEMIFIPSLSVVLKHPDCVGDVSEYITYAGRNNPDSSYPFSDAFDQAQLLEIHSIAMTMRIIASIKLFKSIPWFDPTGIQNGQNFIDNWENWNTPLVISEEWWEKNPDGKLPFGWIKPPQGGIDLERLEMSMESQIDSNTQNPAVMQGQSTGSHASARQTQTLTSNALNSAKVDYYPYELMITEFAERLKNKIAENKLRPHRFNYMGKTITINDEGGDINLMDAAPNCMAVVREADNDESIETNKEMRIENLLMNGQLPYNYAISNMGLDNPEQIISQMEEQNQAMAILKQIQELNQINPQAGQMIIQEIQQASQKAMAEGAQLENDTVQQPPSQQQ